MTCPDYVDPSGLMAADFHRWIGPVVVSCRFRPLTFDRPLTSRCAVSLDDNVPIRDTALVSSRFSASPLTAVIWALGIRLEASCRPSCFIVTAWLTDFDVIADFSLADFL